MDKSRSDLYRATLEAKCRELTGQVSSRVNELKEFSEIVQDVGDQGDQSVLYADEDVNHQILEMGKLNLAQVNRALAKIADGTFGVCSECGEEIHEARLKAIPWADICIDCARDKERSGQIKRIPHNNRVLFDEV